MKEETLVAELTCLILLMGTETLLIGSLTTLLHSERRSLGLNSCPPQTSPVAGVGVEKALLTNGHVHVQLWN